MQSENLLEFERSLSELLQSTSVSNAINQISVQDVRKWAFEYSQDYQLEIQKFPEIINEPHWTLFAKDGFGAAAIFVLLTFTPKLFGILVGNGDAAEIRDFGENTDSDVETAIKEAKSQFENLSEIIELPVSFGYQWIESYHQPDAG